MTLSASPSSATDPVSSIDIPLPEDPRDFDFEKVYIGFRTAACLALCSGVELDHSGCRCSTYPFHDLVNMAVRGALFEDCPATPHDLAIALTKHLYGEVARVYENQHPSVN